MNPKNFVLGVAIIIVTIAVVVYGINTFYSKPVYEDFCGVYTAEYINTSARCEESGGKWVDYNAVPKGDVEGYCDRDFYCREEYDNSMEGYRRNVFMITIPLGIIIIAIGALFFSLDAVGAGLMGGGVGTIIYGLGGYWQYTENWLRCIISAVGLVALIWLAYYANKKWGKEK
jgi:hypothetical protein